MTKLEPILRWAGGKRWLLNNLDQLIPNQINNYFEPFLGSAAVFFHIYNNRQIKGRYYLSDLNSDLINCYTTIRDSSDSLNLSLISHKNTKEYYYIQRKFKSNDKVELASQFLFFNRTAFNGIYRVNKKGEFNVPYGYRQYKELFNYSNIKMISHVLSYVNIGTMDFENALKEVQKDDFVFLDPPYTVAHNNNHFIKYNQNIFSWDDQLRLFDCVIKINRKGVKFVLTNACHTSIRDLYSKYFNIIQIERPSTVGGKNAKRQKINELIIHNIN